MSEEREIRIEVGEKSGAVSGLLMVPDDARAILVLGHGAGAGMRHSFLVHVARDLASRGIATLRYQFPYMEAKKNRVDSQPVSEATVRAAIDAAAVEAAGLPLFAGGKSFGGRMTSSALAKQHDARVSGLVFHGFPLHAAGMPGRERAAHLADVRVPMLFLQGTRDALADLELMRTVTDELGERSTLHVVEGGDHSFAVRKKDGRTGPEVFEELAEAVAGFVARHGGSR